MRRLDISYPKGYHSVMAKAKSKKKKKLPPKKKRDEKDDTKIRIRKAHSREISIRAVRLNMEKMRLVSLLAVIPFHRLQKLTDTVLRGKKRKKKPVLKVHSIEIGK